MSDYRLSTLYDPQTLSIACLWYVLHDFKILPQEKFIPWVVSVTGNTQIHEDIQGRFFVCNILFNMMKTLLMILSN